MTTGLLSDYTELVKAYVPQGQKQSLWEQFFTGTTEAYQGLAEQTQTAHSYDISDAYANYKQQQLQLKANEQLGSGFKQQAASQLQSEYGSAYQNIKSQEATALSNIAQQYSTTLEKGQEQFSQIGEQLRTYDELISEYSDLVEIAKPENATLTTRDKYGVTTEELTDYGRLWYNDVLSATTSEGQTFDQWVLSENSSSNVDYENRVAFVEAYKQNPELFKAQVAGLTSDFDANATRTRLANEERLLVLADANFNTQIQQAHGDKLSSLSIEQITQLKTDANRNKYLVSTGPFRANRGGSWIDDYGTTWKMETDVTELSDKYTEGVEYKQGDVVFINGNYYFVYSGSNGQYGVEVIKITK